MNHPLIETENEINFFDIIRIVWKRKLWISLIVFVFCVIWTFLLLSMHNIYESKAILRSTQSSMGQMSSLMSNLGGLASLAGISTSSSGTVSTFDALNTIIYDNDFLYSFIINNKLQKHFLKNQTNLDDKAKMQILQSAKSSISFTVQSKTNLITLSFKSKDREFNKTFVMKMLVALSSKYKSIEMKNIQQRIDNYKTEIDKTNDITLKNKLSDVVAGLIQDKVLSQAQEYYGFDILVYPTVPNKLDKKSPRRTRLLIIAFFCSSFVASAGFAAYDIYKAKQKTA